MRLCTAPIVIRYGTAYFSGRYFNLACRMAMVGTLLLFVGVDCSPARQAPLKHLPS